MRVLHVITGLCAGGAEHQLRLLLRRLPYDCEVATLTGPGPVAATIRADGTTVHELPMSSNHDVSVVARLRRLIRDGGFDLVHTHLYRACVHGRVAARLAGVPVVATEHSLGDGFIEGRRTSAGVRWLYRATERMGRTTIAVSGTVAHRLRAWGVPADRIAVIPNGIDAAEFAYDPVLRARTRDRLGIARDTVVIGGVGRLEPAKRFDHLIWALGEVPDTVLLLVGEGSAGAALREQALRSGLGDRVIFTGAVGHTRDMLCAMDVFASPSVQETFGLAVLEALACGLPALYAVCPPLDGVPDSGAQRLSRDPESLPRALRAEVVRLAERDGARLPVPPVATRYDIARLADAVSRLYERIVCAGQPVESKGSPR